MADASYSRQMDHILKPTFCFLDLAIISSPLNLLSLIRQRPKADTRESRIRLVEYSEDMLEADTQP